MTGCLEMFCIERGWASALEREEICCGSLRGDGRFVLKISSSLEISSLCNYLKLYSLGITARMRLRPILTPTFYCEHAERHRYCCLWPTVFHFR